MRKKVFVNILCLVVIIFGALFAPINHSSLDIPTIQSAQAAQELVAFNKKNS